MKVTPLGISGLLLLEPRRFTDQRGWFMEGWNKERYADAGLLVDFVQDNVSYSTRGVLRGLHFQDPHPQGKLVSVLDGEVWDVAVDVRRDSPTFGKWCGEVLSSQNSNQLYIPQGCAHGFVVTSESALFVYKCTTPYRPESERTIRWDDPTLAIPWPISEPIVSDKDRRGMPFEDYLRGSA
jgi:dTDP-4-dehydrorhamnose 3,5-epimerase